jgi:hypothetical protein
MRLLDILIRPPLFIPLLISAVVVQPGRTPAPHELFSGKVGDPGPIPGDRTNHSDLRASTGFIFAACQAG